MSPTQPIKSTRLTIALLLCLFLSVVTASAIPRITSQPADVTTGQGQSFSLTVAATSTRPISIQWYRNGVPIPNARARTFLVGVAVGANAGNYRALVRDITGAVWTRAAVVQVTPGNFAPETLQGQGFNCSVTASTAPFASPGSAFIFDPYSGSYYRIQNVSGAANSSGFYTYEKTGPDTGRITAGDSLVGTVSVVFTWTGTASGRFNITRPGRVGYERGTFTASQSF